MTLVLTDVDIGMIIGFFIAFIGIKGIDYISDALYYRGKNRRNKKQEDKQDVSD